MNILIKVMLYSIGEQLGAMVAHFENDLSKNPDNLEAMKKLALASESYRNFSTGELSGFQEAFDRGYVAVCQDLKRSEELQAADPTPGSPSHFEDGP